MRMKIGIAALAIAAVAAVAVPSAILITAEPAAVVIEEWEHGWKTSRVTATRYRNPHIGYNIGFSFTDHYNEDRAEVGEFFAANDGWLFQGGGFPGAEAFVKFADVTDRETANVKLKKILPGLDKLMADLKAGKQVSIARPTP